MKSNAMREILFRAWDGEQMSEPCNPFVDNCFVFPDGNNIFCNDAGGLEIMQFIGLLDKNGKKIFRGDILGSSNTDIEYDTWDFEDCGFTVCIDIETGWSFTEWQPADGDESMYSIMFCEVVGNIYESPEPI